METVNISGILSAISKFDINSLKAEGFLQYVQNVSEDLTKERVFNNQKSLSVKNV
jgi:hypothetical protein